MPGYISMSEFRFRSGENSMSYRRDFPAFSFSEYPWENLPQIIFGIALRLFKYPTAGDPSFSSCSSSFGDRIGRGGKKERKDKTGSGAFNDLMAENVSPIMIAESRFGAYDIRLLDLRIVLTTLENYNMSILNIPIGFYPSIQGVSCVHASYLLRYQKACVIILSQWQVKKKSIRIFFFY